MNIQETELSLIAEDTNDFLQIMLGIRGHETSGYLALALSPLIGFVSEESHKYLSKQGLLIQDTELFKSFNLAVTKLRALLKLFDYTEGKKDGLSQTLELFQSKSAQWMNAGKSKWQRIATYSLQPDLGIYFINGEIFYLTIVGFSAFGLTRKQIEQLQDDDFKKLSQQAFDFSRAAGEFLGIVVETLEKHVTFKQSYKSGGPKVEFTITHNDFSSKKFYVEVSKRAQLVKYEDAILLSYVLSQVNVAQLLLPKLLPLQSILLFRLRYLTAYHAISALGELRTKTGSELTRLLGTLASLPAIPNERKIRNALAHYGFGEGQKFVVSSTAPLDQIIEGFSGLGRPSVESVISQRLSLISAWTRDILSKQSLTGLRAALGDHT